MSRHAAVDLGASSGRVVVGEVAPRRLELDVVHRFRNRPVRLPSGLHWDVLGLYGHVLDGLRLVGSVDSVGIDSWAVDYGLLSPDGVLLGNPHHYRDERTAAVVDKVHDIVPFARLYDVTGLQFLPFNTIYQLASHEPGALAAAGRLLLVPDLLTYWLTGDVGAEVTNASTTGLLDVRTSEWSSEVAEALGLPRHLLSQLRRPGAVVGPLLPAVCEETGLAAGTQVVAVGSHDTASAVVGVPMAEGGSAYISLGTWGLAGVELDAPVLTDASREANFTNELGVDGRVRFLRNVMGLWLLQESMRAWGRSDLPELLAAAARLPVGPVFDVDDLRLLPPGDMPTRLRTLLAEAGAPPTDDPVHLVRAVVDSLAAALASTVHEAARLSGRTVDTVHVVGGGAQNALLCQRLADVARLPVVAGPVEATAIGNLLVQARALGSISGSLDDLRALVRETQQLVRFEPRR
jgi:rhamnulokinase